MKKRNIVSTAYATAGTQLEMIKEAQGDYIFRKVELYEDHEEYIAQVNTKANENGEIVATYRVTDTRDSYNVIVAIDINRGTHRVIRSEAQKDIVSIDISEEGIRLIIRNISKNSLLVEGGTGVVSVTRDDVATNYMYMVPVKQVENDKISRSIAYAPEVVFNGTECTEPAKGLGHLQMVYEEQEVVPPHWIFDIA